MNLSPVRASGVLAVLCLASSASASEPADLYKAAAPAVVQIVTHEGVATGFLLERPHVVVTAWHVVEHDTDLVVHTHAGDTLKAEAIAWDKEADLAILHLDAPVDATPLELAPELPRIGEPIYAIGQPHLGTEGEPTGEYEGLLGWSFTEGRVAAVGAGRVQVSPGFVGGTSGGPVLNDAGEVIGVAVEAIEGFGLVSPVDAIREFQRVEPRSKPRVPVALGGMGMLALDQQPGVAARRRLRLGFHLEADIVLDRKVLLGLSSRVTWLGSGDERKGTSPDQRLEAAFHIGASFDLPFRPTKGRHATLQPYFSIGLLGQRQGARTWTASFVDPACEPRFEACATTQADTLNWARTQLSPLIGGGLKLNLGPTVYSFDVGTPMTNPGQDFRLGIGIGFRFGGP